MIKVVYFDEDSASDYLDVSSGGKIVATAEDVTERANKLRATMEGKLLAKLSWLPFIGVSAEAGLGTESSIAGQSILRKTLSNTILTDYLGQADEEQIIRLHGFRVTAPKESMAYMKMYTPYMIIAKTEQHGVDLARMDEALTSAKGYYEMLAENRASGEKCILRFNIRAFRNSYGLADLGRMDLTYHGILVGKASEDGLNFNTELIQEATTEPLSAADVLDGVQDGDGGLLDVYDVLFAGVEHVS
ncbi:hypothetical protein TV39_08925 [Arthrobacter sp. SPG23]|nr:hypothetical protein TV39_08925 [Arthrobacter sp. SPG23]